eukprot:2212543-Rhodomonas_salina.2
MAQRWAETETCRSTGRRRVGGRRSWLAFLGLQGVVICPCRSGADGEGCRRWQSTRIQGVSSLNRFDGRKGWGRVKLDGI